MYGACSLCWITGGYHVFFVFLIIMVGITSFSSAILEVYQYIPFSGTAAYDIVASIPISINILWYFIPILLFSCNWDVELPHSHPYSVPNFMFIYILGSPSWYQLSPCISSGMDHNWVPQYLDIWLVVWNLAFIFPYIGNFITPADFHIFQRGRYTTNQIYIYIYRYIYIFPKTRLKNLWSLKSFVTHTLRTIEAQLQRTASRFRPAAAAGPAGPGGPAAAAGAGWWWSSWKSSWFSWRTVIIWDEFHETWWHNNRLFLSGRKKWRDASKCCNDMQWFQCRWLCFLPSQETLTGYFHSVGWIWHSFITWRNDIEVKTLNAG